MSRGNFRIIAIHILIIAALILFEVLGLTITGARFNPVVTGCYYLYNVAFFYFIALVFIPFCEKRFSDILILIDLMILVILAYVIISIFIALLLSHFYFGIWDFRSAFNVAILLLNRGLLFFCAALSYWFAMHSIGRAKEAKLQAQLRHESEKREAVLESRFLRSQLDTHLMGNVLNSVYSGIFRTSPKQASIILLAADILAYCSEHNDESGRVSLQQEISQLRRIIELRQATRDHKLQVIFSADIRGKDNALKIPPLLFSDLVENIFKHGQLYDQHRPAQIQISVSNKVLYFRSWNQHIARIPSSRTGIGLANTRARLLKHYGNAHTLSIDNTDTHFMVELNIRL
ncbi:histidine kinase [Chitinophaga sp. OAE865]|uniref:sensor histidine kinase n=1 Tax=Chitinophaga sp. OAE865 TaxID=2817898 RepID=UPI001AE49D25